MWRSGRWIGHAVGTAVLAMVNVLPAGCAAQPRKQSPEAVDVIRDPRSLAGGSWGVISDSEQSAGRVAPMVIGQHLEAGRQARPSPAWLDLHGGRSRAVNREPDLGRYEF